MAESATGGEGESRASADDARMMRAGDSVPDFEAHTLDGRAIRYRDLWQNKLLVLVTFALPSSEPARAYRGELMRSERDLTAYDTCLLLASPHGSPFPAPSLVIADRWGEIRFVAHPADDGGLPGINEILEWLRFVQMECPECQGETR